jgi:glyoxylase I family protein
MARGSISHIALSVSDLERSAAFYDRVFEFIGFKRVEVPEATQQAMKTRLKAWVGPGYSISIRPSKGEFAHRLNDRNAAGFNHMAFTADDQSDVERMYELLKEMGAKILDAAAEYLYSPDTSQSISLPRSPHKMPWSFPARRAAWVLQQSRSLIPSAQSLSRSLVRVRSESNSPTRAPNTSSRPKKRI